MSYTPPTTLDFTWSGLSAYTPPTTVAFEFTATYGRVESSFAASLLGVSASSSVTATATSFASSYQYSRPILGNLASSFASSYQYSSPTIGSILSNYASGALFSLPTLFLPTTPSSFAAPGFSIVAQHTLGATASAAQVGQLVLATHMGGVSSAFASSPLSVEAVNNLATTAPSFTVNPPYTLNWFQLSSYASAPVVSPLSMPDAAPLDATASRFVSVGHAFHGYTTLGTTTSRYASSTLGLDTDWTLTATESRVTINLLTTSASIPLVGTVSGPVASPLAVRSFNELLSRASASASGEITHISGQISVALASTPSRFAAPYLVVRYGRFPVFSALVSDGLLLTSEPDQWATEEVIPEELYMDTIEQRVYAYSRAYKLYYRPPLAVVYGDEHEKQVFCSFADRTLL